MLRKNRSLTSTLSLALLVALVPAAAEAQSASNSPQAIIVQVGGGATAAADFGSVHADGGTATQILNFTIDAGTTIGSINFLTSGMPYKYFVDAGTTTCLVQTYADTTNCVVSVKFQPIFSGSHSGAVTIADGSGTVLATAYLHGQSTGPQLAFGHAPTAAFGTGFTDPAALAVDPKANVFVADSSAGTLTKVDVNGVKTVLDDALVTPTAIALDGAGNIYVADTTALKVYKEFPAGGRVDFAPLVLHPTGVAVDPAGNVYIADGLLGTISKVTPAGILTKLTLNVLTSPGPMALDAAGNLYVVCSGNRIIKITRTGAETTFATGLSSANGIAVDAAGSVYVSDLNNARPVIYRYSPARVKSTLLMPATTMSTATGGLAVHLDSNIFYGVGGTGTAGSVQLLSRLDSTPITFPTTTPGGSADTKDGPLGEPILNVGNATYVLSAVTYPEDFVAGGTGHLCTSTTKLAPSGSCTFTAIFQPLPVNTARTLTEMVILVGNDLNIPSHREQITFTGARSLPKLTPTLTLSAPATTTADAPTLITAQLVTTGAAPTGTINFFAGSTRLGTAPAAATVTRFFRIPVGTTSLTATYSGDSTYLGVTSPADPITVSATKATPTVSLTSSVNPVTSGSSTMLTAVVSESISGVVPTGTVNFYHDGSLKGTATLNGTGSASISFVGPATSSTTTYDLNAVYSGDSAYATATSNTVLEVINK